MYGTFLPFALPDVDECELAEIADALKSGWITTGPKTHQFETEFAAYVGAKHAIAVNSCTAAMHLALEAIGLEPGDEVITSPYTFAATAEVVRYFAAKPVFVDICPTDLNINPNLIEGAITRRTKAIIPVHIAGLPADLEAIYTIAARHGLAVIEDAAHAFPARYKDQTIGAAFLPAAFNQRTPIGGSQEPAIIPLPPPSRPLPGDVPAAVCFSFYATKTITTGEGGMICTHDDDLADRCRIMALHGISRDAWKRYSAEGSWYYEIIAPGFKYNMTDVTAAMGLAQLGKAERMWRRRCEIARHYHTVFDTLPELHPPADRADCQHAWHLYILRLNLERLRLDRAQFIQELKRLNIGTSVHFIPLHLHPYYRDTYGYAPADFPVAFSEFQRVVSLPIYSRMSNQDTENVIDSVFWVVNQWRKF